MKLLETFGTDPKKESEGVEHTFGQGKDAWTMKIARWGNPKFKEAVDNLLEKDDRYSGLVKAGENNHEYVVKCKNKVIAQTILVGWTNLQDSEGKDIPYTVENAEKVLNDPRLHDWRDKIIFLSQEVEHFRYVNENIKALKKNSSPSSNSTSGSGAQK